MVLGRWLLVTAASAGSGLLLLSSLGWALAHPGGGADGAVVRLGWCLIPVLVTVQLAVAVGRAQPAGWPRTGLSAVGLGRTGVVMLAAACAAVTCTLGSAVALAVFLQLRGDVVGVPWNGVGPGLLAAGRPLPPAGAITLLALVPVAAAAATAFRLREERPPAHDAPGTLPWGVSLVAVGLAAELTAPSGHEVPLPSGLGSISPAALAAWAVTAIGMVLAGPGIVHLCGRLTASFRPGAVRLLAGRALQYEARRIGYPLGLLCATASAALAAWDGAHALGPVSSFAAALIAVCVLATSALALTETRNARTAPRAALHAVAASPAVLRGAVAVRAGVLFAVLVPVTVLVAALSTYP
ncbi:hypothetical protein V2S66_02765 [Streptomyces sp. V4-01]|uniref:Integral membrane protein n=1 Tax=Actinacidiphila polyblastidii TaxID=3110430 RepID=A0ABU7P4Z9_9ACTN|nr:hypothetical protein [Streptomyces sp. V4-01]